MRYLTSISLAVVVLMALACTATPAEPTTDIDATVEARAKELVAKQVKPNPALALEYYEKASGSMSAAADHQSLGGLQSAIRDFTMAIELGLPTTHHDGRNPLALAYLLRGGSYLGLNEYQNAIEDFDKVIRIDSDNETTAHAYRARGEAYKELGQRLVSRMLAIDTTAKTEADYAKACELDGIHCD